MINKRLADYLNEIGDYLELDEANVFRIRAIRRGAEVVETHSEDFARLKREDMLKIPGIGKGIADIAEGFISGSKLPDIEKLKKKYPDGVLKIMNLQGLGPRRAAVLYKKLKISSLENLAKAAKQNKLTKLSGFGPKLQESLLKNIAYVQETSKRFLISEALDTAHDYLSHLKKNSLLKNTTIAGSLRRWKETIGDLDILCTSKNPVKAIDHFLAFKRIDRVLLSGKTKTSVVLDSGIQCDFRVVEEKSFGAALMYFSGSKEHNVRLREIAQKKNLTLNEYGLFKLSDKKRTKPIAGRTEEEVYKKLGLQWIPPELREDRGEIEAAQKKSLPDLISEQDIQGDFHNHTDRSDGEHSLEAMVEAAQNKGWSWFYSADHSPSLTIANGLSVARLNKKIEDIKKIQKTTKFPVYCSTEVDILKNGEIDYPDDTLKKLDCVVASVHSRFNQSEEEMTDRLCNALKNPHVDILGHISGRRLNTRKGYDLNYDRVFDVAKSTQTAIEINGQAERQELQDIHLKKAISMGIPLALTTDAHSTQQLDNMTLAVHIARRGWVEKKNVLNTYSQKQIEKWFKR